MANARISIFIKKVIMTNIENSAEVGLFDQLFYSYKFYSYQNVYIFSTTGLDLSITGWVKSPEQSMPFI